MVATSAPPPSPKEEADTLKRFFLHEKVRSKKVNSALFSVGNIPYQTTEDAIGNYFSQAGNVTNVRIVYDRETGRPKGFGFCEFSDEAGAQNAVNTLNGADFNGRSLRVNWANKN
ncbi:unnamed protein product [Cylicostephanus goldi]|uniref:RRM domain-containing protein n=1 Tax=Cylicostephanus goldi TaxID=71465 RepID=A0A3P6SH20_CYLGO|nr:unnamed protein product [Cylicostephanus goldi]